MLAAHNCMNKLFTNLPSKKVVAGQQQVRRPGAGGFNQGQRLGAHKLLCLILALTGNRASPKPRLLQRVRPAIQKPYRAVSRPVAAGAPEAAAESPDPVKHPMPGAGKVPHQSKFLACKLTSCRAAGSDFDDQSASESHDLQTDAHQNAMDDKTVAGACPANAQRAIEELPTCCVPAGHYNKNDGITSANPGTGEKSSCHTHPKASAQMRNGWPADKTIGGNDWG